MTIPIEFIAYGRPSSVNGSSAKKIAWKTAVATMAQAELNANFPGVSASLNDVTVKIFFCPANITYGDIDNGVKHTIDAMSVPLASLMPVPPHAPVLANDRTVMRVIAERFLPAPGAGLVVPIGIAPSLATAILAANGTGPGGVPAPPQYATAIKMEAYMPNNGAFW